MLDFTVMGRKHLHICQPTLNHFLIFEFNPLTIRVSFTLKISVSKKLLQSCDVITFFLLLI